MTNKEPGSAEREALLAAKECLELALGVREDYPYGRGKPDDELVLQIAERSGFGHLLTLLSAAWRRKARRDGMPDGGEFLVGPCRYTAEQALAKVNAALRAAHQAPQAPAPSGPGRPMTLRECMDAEDSSVAAVGAQAAEQGEPGCARCDGFGSAKTYANQALMPLDGKVRCIDWCIHHIVAALNAGGVRTVACCCGHGQLPGRIDLEDGRVLTITKGDRP